MVTGTVAYRERMALPSDAVVEVRLSDVSRQDVAAPLIAETTVLPAPAREGLRMPAGLQFDAQSPKGFDPKNRSSAGASDISW